MKCTTGGKSEFQEIEVVQTHAFGKLLITDGLMQSSECDEVVYHEALVHPAMTLHGKTRSECSSPAAAKERL